MKWLVDFVLRHSDELLIRCFNSLEVIEQDYPVGGCYSSNGHYRKHKRGLYRVTKLIQGDGCIEVYGTLVFERDLADCTLVQIEQAINREKECAHSWHNGGKAA